MVADTDGDTLTDGDEAALGTDPLRADSDDDRLDDGVEVQMGTSPLDPDTDGDGLPDADEASDSRLDPLTPGDDDPEADDADGDLDGLTTARERALRTNPNRGDSDGDGLGDGFEVDVLGTNPRSRDTDGDGEDDGDEMRRGEDPRVSSRQVELPAYLEPWTAGRLGGGGELRFEDDIFARPAVDGVTLTWDRAHSDPAALSLSLATRVPVPGVGFRRRAVTGRLMIESADAAPPTVGYTLLEDELTNLEPHARSVELAYAALRGAPLASDLGPEGLVSWMARMRSSIDLVGDAARPVFRGSVDDGLRRVSTQVELPACGRRVVIYVVAGVGFVAGVGHGPWMPAETQAAVVRAERAEPPLQAIEDQLVTANLPYVLDADADGLVDDDEAAAGCAPDQPDTDGDGLLDGFEVRYGLDPTTPDDPNADRDDDGLSLLDEQRFGGDPRSADTDGDGLMDGDEVVNGGCPNQVDGDGDGVDDATERLLGLRPAESDGQDDADLDGLSDSAELAIGTRPTDSDTDADGLLDGDEVHGLSDPLTPDADHDDDGDGLDTAMEIALGTDPWRMDSDGDYLADADEVSLGTDPASPDTDGDGVRDDIEHRDGGDPLRFDDRWPVVVDVSPSLRLDGSTVRAIPQEYERLREAYTDLSGFAGSPSHLCGAPVFGPWCFGMTLGQHSFTEPVPRRRLSARAWRDGSIVRQVFSYSAPVAAPIRVRAPLGVRGGPWSALLGIEDEAWTRGLFVVSPSRGDAGQPDPLPWFLVRTRDGTARAPAAEALGYRWTEGAAVDDVLDLHVPPGERALVVRLLAVTDDDAEAAELRRLLSPPYPDWLFDDFDAQDRADVVNLDLRADAPPPDPLIFTDTDGDGLSDAAEPGRNRSREHRHGRRWRARWPRSGAAAARRGAAPGALGAGRGARRRRAGRADRPRLRGLCAQLEPRAAVRRGGPRGLRRRRPVGGLSAADRAPGRRRRCRTGR
ncbi:MAG: hypothetical protein H6704_07875 [Myxococcales bacterium]|nr:hypothetical protein [Myxococcales bacterium]